MRRFKIVLFSHAFKDDGKEKVEEKVNKDPFMSVWSNLLLCFRRKRRKKRRRRRRIKRRSPRVKRRSKPPP